MTNVDKIQNILNNNTLNKTANLDTETDKTNEPLKPVSNALLRSIFSDSQIKQFKRNAEAYSQKLKCASAASDSRDSEKNLDDAKESKVSEHCSTQPCTKDIKSEKQIEGLCSPACIAKVQGYQNCNDNLREEVQRLCIIRNDFINETKALKCRIESLTSDNLAVRSQMCDYRRDCTAKDERIVQLSAELNKALNDLSKTKFDIERCKSLSDKAKNMFNRHIGNRGKNGLGYVEIAPPMNGTNSFVPLTKEELEKEKKLVYGVFKSTGTTDAPASSLSDIPASSPSVTPAPTPIEIPASLSDKQEVKVSGVSESSGSCPNQSKPDKEDRGKGVFIPDEKPGDVKGKDLINQRNQLL